jgi:hypothetical protein
MVMMGQPEESPTMSRDIRVHLCYFLTKVACSKERRTLVFGVVIKFHFILWLRVNGVISLA